MRENNELVTNILRQGFAVQSIKERADTAFKIVDESFLLWLGEILGHRILSISHITYRSRLSQPIEFTGDHLEDRLEVIRDVASVTRGYTQ